MIMKLHTFIVVCFTLLLGISAEQCGRQASGATCSNGLCCSEHGWCGTTPAYCATGCQSQCTPGGGSTPVPSSPTPSGGGGDVAGIVSSSLFDQMLKYRNDPRCKGNGFYKYDAFITAARSFSGFGTTGDDATRKKELAAFLAQTSHETTGGWGSAPDGPYAWGYCFVNENNQDVYCDSSPEYPCAPGKKYYGRGPIQLTHNYNYGQAGAAIREDLLNNPDLVATDPVVAFKTAIWFWMTPQANKPSSHDVITGRWNPSTADTSAGRVPGFGVITNIINGGVECGHGPDDQVADRIGFYRRYSDMLAVSPGSNLDCYNQRPFSQPPSSKKPPSLSSPSHKPQTHLSGKPPPQNSGKTRTRTHNPFTSPNLSDAKRVFNSIATSTKAPLDLRPYNALLQSYAAISTVNDSIALFNHMIKTQPAFSPELSTYHILLAQSCTVPDQPLQSVHQVLNFMVNNGFHPDKVTTDIAVRSLCLAGHVDEAVEVMKQMAVKNAVPDTYTYNFLVKCLCKSRVLSTVRSFIDEMKSFDLKPDLVTYTIMIDNVANSKNLREATRLVKELKEEGFKPDCYVYNTIMKGYCMLSKGNEVVQVLKDMEENGVEPDLVTYNTVIFGLSKCGRVVEAKKYLRIMVEKGHFPDEVTYTSMMNGLCRKGDAVGAVALLAEMQVQGCSPNECTYNTLLHGLCKGRFLEKGMELYGLMKKDGMKLDTASYGTLVRTLCRAGRVADAYEVFDYAVESKSLTNVSAYLTLETTVKQLKKAQT